MLILPLHISLGFDELLSFATQHKNMATSFVGHLFPRSPLAATPGTKIEIEDYRMIPRGFLFST